MQEILITGGTGMIGRQLTKYLSNAGYGVIILTRKIPTEKHADPNVSYALWNVEEQTIDLKAVQNASYIIHLAGAGVMDKRWTAAYKAKIQNSRTESSALLVRTLQQHPHSVRAVVSASAIGWYGEDPPPARYGFVESDKPAQDFLGQTCLLWEQSIDPISKLGIRLVKLRTGIVLSNEGGALPEFKKPLRVGVAGILSQGKQVVSWIHIDDLCRIYIEALKNEQLAGSYNAVAPGPVTNKQLNLELARQLKGRFYVPVHIPKIILKLLLGQRSIEVLKSSTVNCEKIRQARFTFLYPSIEAAIHQLCTKAAN